MKILIIDNYDSFTYNLVHLVNEIGFETEVWRNDQYQLSDVASFEKIILSPGPGIPSESGLLMQTIKTYAETKSIFGVCLGLQAIAEVFGGDLYNLSQPFHGVATHITITDASDSLFKGIPTHLKVGRYHSWAVNKSTLPSALHIIAEDETGVIMALRHRTLNICGVQFHPESVLTEYGKKILENWLLL